MEAERTVDAPMDVVWRRQRDYRAGRARMLTEQFAGYAVLLTPGGEGERTLVRVEAVLRDPAVDGWLARARARRALRRVHERLLARLDRQLADGR